MVQNSVLDDDRKFLTLTLVLPVLLFSVSLLLSYSCNHTTTTSPPQTNLTETTEDSKTEMETITPPTITTTSPSTSTTSSTVEMIVGGVKIEKNPSESKLAQLGVSSWPKWGCGPSKFPWTFKANETMYLLEGKVNVYTEGYDGFFEIGAGDLVEFPKGMKVTWDVIESVNKHYYLEK
ncbi:uncharacterized protein LOC131314429 [Rhododendron vialii]|uniref:uncharacterized protein LOC131314429 n=1 Tax=Rhododendron vialii TaxID=182163 RepID=UPI00265E115D|nr:uncharacterized protein LOC131314429 [Rhododendron vialii]